MRVAVIVLADVFDTGLSAVLDAFETAGQLSDDGHFEVSAVGVRREVRTHQGFSVPVVAPPRRAPDLVVVPAVACKQPHELLPALERADVREAIDLLRAWSGKGTRIAAACTGTFVLGKAGLLDGKRATTTWWLGPTFRKEFPAVELDDSQMVVSDGGVITAGAALAHLDLVLALIRDRSPSLASLVARYLVLDDRASQALFVAPDHVAYDDDIVKRFEAWIRRRIAEPFELGRAARAIGTSERTLQRRVRAVLGRRPIELVQDLRLERAVHLLRATKGSVDEIAQRVGYEDGSTLRTLLRRRMNTGVRELRPPRA